MICRIYDVQGGKLEHYEAVTKRTGREKPDGVHAHIVGETDGGFTVIEVWDSPEHIERYMEQGLGQAIQEVMQEAEVPEPTVTEFEVHKLDWLG
jgi:quinol monooxygenase YgiN